MIQDSKTCRHYCWTIRRVHPIGQNSIRRLHNVAFYPDMHALHFFPAIGLCITQQPRSCINPRNREPFQCILLEADRSKIYVTCLRGVTAFASCHVGFLELCNGFEYIRPSIGHPRVAPPCGLVVGLWVDCPFYCVPTSIRAMFA